MKFSLKVSLLFILSLGVVQGFAQKISIEQLIREVCTNSDSVKMMRENLIRSKQTIKEKYSAALPKISSSVSAGRMFPFYQGLYFDTSIYSANIQITQPIYTFGKVGAAINVAREYDQSVNLNFNRSIQELQLLGLDTYYRVILSEKDLLIKRQSYSRKKELSEFLSRNFNMGSGSKAYVLSAEADLKSCLPEIIKAEQNVRSTKMVLCMITGRDLNDTVELDTTSLSMLLNEFQRPTREDALKNALEKRADLKSLNHLKNANIGGAKIFKAMYYPSIGANAQMGIEIADLENFRWMYRKWMIGVGLNWQFFDGFENSSKSQQYRSDARKLEIASKAIWKSVELEIDTLLAEYDAADSNLVASQEMLRAAGEAYDLTSELFRQGSGQLSELQQAEERFSLAEMGIIYAHYRVKRSRAALLIAMGLDIIKVEER